MMAVGSSANHVFVLGAGFSKAASSHFPLTRELFKPCLEAMRRYRLEAADDREVLESFERLGSDMEVWLSWLGGDHPWLDEASSMRNRAAFSDVSRGIASAILRAQNAAVVATTNPPGWLLALVRSWGERKSSVITLNYDTVVEKAFESFVPASSVLLYSFGLATLSGAGRLGGSADEQFSLYKLHGSISWYVFSGSLGRLSPVYDGELRRSWDGPDDEADILKRVGGRLPLIVPPVLGKDQYFGLPELRDQWLRADLALREAKRMFVVGYSLPATDLMMRYFLDRMPQDCEIVPVNRNPAVADRLSDLLKPRTVNRDYVGGPDVIPEFARTYAGTR